MTRNGMNLGYLSLSLLSAPGCQVEVVQAESACTVFLIQGVETGLRGYGSDSSLASDGGGVRIHLVRIRKLGLRIM